MVTEQTIDTKRIMKQFYLSILCLAFIAGGGISTAVQASDKADSTTNRRYVGKLDSIQKINEVIIVGTPVIPKYREVIPAQVLKEVDLQRLNSLSVADAIRYFAGVQLKDYGGVGGLKTVNIRSMGTNHMAVFYDGIQLGNAQNGQVDLGRFSLDDVEEISLYNGQKSDIFQSAKDFGASGTIYITTRRPRFEEGKRANFKATMKTGSFGLINPSMRYEYKISDAVSSSFSGEWINATGRYKFRYRRRNTLGEIAYDTTAYRQNGDINATRMEAGLHGKMADGQWTVRAYTYNSERGIPGAIVNNVFRHGEHPLRESRRQVDPNQEHLQTEGILLLVRQPLQHLRTLGGVAGLRLPVEHARRHFLHAHRKRWHLPLSDALYPYGRIGHGI